MPDAASLDRTVKVGDQVDRLFAETPGVLNRSVINGYSIIDAGLQDQLVDAVRHAEGLRGALQVDRQREARESAHDPDRRLQEVVRHQRGTGAADRATGDPRASARRAASSSGSSRTAAAIPAQLDALTQQFLKAAQRATGADRAQHDVPRQHAATEGRRQSRQGDVAGRAGAGRLQRDPGAVRLADRQPVQPVQPLVVRDPAVRCALPPDARRTSRKLYTRNQHGQMVPLTALVTTSYVTGPDLMPHFNGFPAAKIIGSQAPGFSSGQAIETMEEVAQQVLPDGYQLRVVGPGVRREARRRHVDGRLPVRPDLRVPGAGRAVRVVDAAGRGDDGGAVRRAGRADLQLRCAGSTTTCTSRSGCWC